MSTHPSCVMKESGNVQRHHIGHLSLLNFLSKVMDQSPESGSRFTIVAIICFEIFGSSARVEFGIHEGIRRAACVSSQTH
jgi:hypothetical protein